MSGPKRIQMSRQRPWRAEHPDAVIVDRRTRWGNWYVLTKDTSRTPDRGWWVGMASDPTIAGPYEHKAKAAGKAVNWFREDCQEVLRAETDGSFYADLAELRGRDLACWCPLDQPCHADVLLELANAPDPAERGSSSLPAVLPPLVTALLLVLSVAYREPVRTLVWLTPLALLLLAVVVGCVWLAGRLTARPPMTEHLRDEAAVLIERSK